MAVTGARDVGVGVGAGIVSGIFGVGGLVGAVIGSAIVARLQAWILQIAFAAILVAAAARMVTATNPDAGGSPPALSLAMLLAYAASGVAMGGLVGAVVAQRPPLTVLTWLFAGLLCLTAMRLARASW